MTVMHLDFETFSSASLPDTGTHVYSCASDLVVTVIAWAFGEGPVKPVLR